MVFQGLGPRNWPSLYNSIPVIQEAIHRGQDVLSAHDIWVEGQPLNLVKACREGGLQLEEHSQTCWQQPCIFLASMALWKVWLEQNRESLNEEELRLLGFSFGEWSAATAAGCLPEEIGLLVVTMRGILTSQAGGSSLLINARSERLPIKDIWIQCKMIKRVWLANINSPFQGLISGEEASLSQLEITLKELNKSLVVRSIKLEGAFHTPLMQNARKELTKRLVPLEFKAAKVPLMLNATGEVTTNPASIKEKLLRQMSARLNFKCRAQEIPPDAEIHELCIVPGSSPATSFIQQTHQVKYRRSFTGLVAAPFPA
ncbi:MAG: acyltransferase domain-containing protein [Patescibacteria group bacterium]